MFCHAVLGLYKLSPHPLRLGIQVQTLFLSDIGKLATPSDHVTEESPYFRCVDDFERFVLQICFTNFKVHFDSRS